MSTGEELIEKVRKHALGRGVCGIKSIGRMFRLFDDNGCKKLDFNELKYGLLDYGIKLTDEEVRTLYTYFDKNGDGAIVFDEFLQALRPPMSQARVKLVNTAFKKLDRTGDKKVTLEDLKNVYDYRHHPKYKSGEWSASRVFQEFLNTFQPPGEADDTVTEDEFLNYYSGVSASIDEDIYFDFMMRQAWKL